MNHPALPPSPRQNRLTVEAMLSAWETGDMQPPVERALALLAEAHDAGLLADPAACSIGERDSLLLDLHAGTFGARIEGMAICSRCGERLDVSFDTAQIRTPFGASTREFELAVAADNGNEGPADTYHLTFRLPATPDLRDAPSYETWEEARRALAERCIVRVESGGETLQPPELPDEVIDRLSEAMSSCDPQGDVRLDMICPECQAKDQIIFDIAGFLWRKVDWQARQLLSDVHALALVYGWSQAEILSLSPARRQWYLDMVMG